MTTPSADDIKDAAATNASEGISSVTVDGNTSVALDPMKQLDVADRLAQQTAATRGHLGLRFSKIIPGGTG